MFASQSSSSRGRPITMAFVATYGTNGSTSAGTTRSYTASFGDDTASRDGVLFFIAAGGRNALPDFTVTLDGVTLTPISDFSGTTLNRMRSKAFYAKSVSGASGTLEVTTSGATVYYIRADTFTVWGGTPAVENSYTVNTSPNASTETRTATCSLSKRGYLIGHFGELENNGLLYWEFHNSACSFDFFPDGVTGEAITVGTGSKSAAAGDSVNALAVVGATEVGTRKYTHASFNYDQGSTLNVIAVTSA